MASLASLANLDCATAVLALQIANGETGVISWYNEIISQLPSVSIACDFANAGIGAPLPDRWDSAFFDSKSWQGPEGLGILAINNESRWRNPLPHLGPKRVPGSASLPLIIASAIALEATASDALTTHNRLRELSAFLRQEITSKITHCDIAGNLDSSLPHINSFSFLYVEGEELLRHLDKAGFAVDSGSACNAEDLTPSHVLAAMGVLTHGNIRITLQESTSKEDVVELVRAIERAVAELRSR